MQKQATEFLLYSYLGITIKELEDAKTDKQKRCIAYKCAQRAYLDLNRTLNFKEKAEKNGLKPEKRKEITNKHLTFSDKICEKIVNGIIEDLFQSKNADEFNDFNNKHFKICDSIQKYACGTDVLETIKLSDECKKKRKEKCDDQKFYYGQAQKWLNMTLKYMWLLGLWKSEFKKIEKCVHVPVDSYIIKYVWNTKVDLPMLRKERKDYGSERVVPWSRWSEKEYKSFQKSLREVFGEKKPLEWEGEAWINAAKGLILDENMEASSTKKA